MIVIVISLLLSSLRSPWIIDNVNIDTHGIVNAVQYDIDDDHDSCTNNRCQPNCINL